MSEITVNHVIALVERALRAEILEPDLAELWPGRPAGPYLAAVREDIALGLEHIPGRRGPGRWQADLVAWSKMPECDDLERHLVRLRALAAAPEA